MAHHNFATINERGNLFVGRNDVVLMLHKEAVAWESDDRSKPLDPNQMVPFMLRKLAERLDTLR